jgi:hypothetical protein
MRQGHDDEKREQSVPERLEECGVEPSKELNETEHVAEQEVVLQPVREHVAAEERVEASVTIDLLESIFEEYLTRTDVVGCVTVT